jgi:outer membrane protein assembly factor BamB
MKDELKPVAFKTPDGRDGWVMRLPGNRPIATPAIADGLIYVGGGYGSHEFYALKADTGEVAWQIKTADDGPTAAVVEDGCVAFNTESCTVIVTDVRTGKLLWQEWLGDPLMSQPAIANGKLYIAYPGGHPRGAQNQAQAPAAAPNVAAVANVGPAQGAGHRLLCADLKTGKHLWEQDITADVISAPVIEGEQVFLTCFDGTSFCIGASDGKIAWKKEHAGTSAPLVVAGRMLVTAKGASNGKTQEGIQQIDTTTASNTSPQMLAAGDALYLNRGAEGNVALSPATQAALESSVGFAGGAPQAAQMHKAAENVNVQTVAAGWAYQGSRVAYAKGQVLNAQGSWINCVAPNDKSGQPRWRAQARGGKGNADAQRFAPPALGKDNLYLCGAAGELLSLAQEDGAVRFSYTLKHPMAFQPALSGGNVYAGTADGYVVCLKTGDTDADGWTAWGGNARHNKKD